MKTDENNSVLKMLEQRTIQHPDRIALIYEPDEKVTYAELWELSGRVYAWLINDIMNIFRRLNIVFPKAVSG